MSPVQISKFHIGADFFFFFLLLKQANLSSFIKTHSRPLLLYHLCSLPSLNYIAVQCSTISKCIFSWKQEQMSKAKLV